MNDFMKGFIKGAKETPQAFFAPAIAIWRLLLNTTESIAHASWLKQGTPVKPVENLPNLEAFVSKHLPKNER